MDGNGESQTKLWWSTGVHWEAEQPVLGWYHERFGERSGAGLLGAALGLTAGAGRRCPGVRRGRRRLACPAAAAVPVGAAGAQCEACNALDRARSVAADTAPDDPRPFHLYLAYFSADLVKVGITAVERGRARLLEQGAVAHLLIGRGPLMAARRGEALLGAALGLPDRVHAAAKRTARTSLPPVAERLARLHQLGVRARALADWPEALERLQGDPADHSSAYGLDPTGAPTTAGRIASLVPGGGVAGTVRAVVGHDLYLESAAGLLLLDGRHLAGWPLTRSPGAATTVPVVDTGADTEARQDSLF